VLEEEEVEGEGEVGGLLVVVALEEAPPVPAAGCGGVCNAADDAVAGALELAGLAGATAVVVGCEGW
jgi:hypothetical protein